MIETPWSLVLTAIFLATAVLCALHLAGSRRASAGTALPSPDEHCGPVGTAVHVNHLVMSLAMLLMVWRPVGSAGTWVQVALFALFALVMLVMLVGLTTVRGASERIGVLTHVLLNAAMIWMLLAMPLLMGHAMGGSSEAGAAHHGGGSGEGSMMEMAPTPDWVTWVNWTAVALSAAVAVWWIVRLLRAPAHRTLAACHLLMAAGMALMLALM